MRFAKVVLVRYLTNASSYFTHLTIREEHGRDGSLDDIRISSLLLSESSVQFSVENLQAFQYKLHCGYCIGLHAHVGV